MRRRNQKVKSLYILTAKRAGSVILEGLVKHTASNCKFCNLIYTMEGCTDLKPLKIQLTELPVLPRTKIFDKIRLNASAKFDEIPYKGNKNLRRKVDYLLAWMFECKNIRLTHIIEYPEDVFLVLRFGKYVDALSFKDHEHFQLSYLDDVLRFANTLLCLDFGIIHITENIFKTIGKHCKIMRELRCCIPYKEYKPIMLLSLLFEDPETQLKRNSCCDTLGCLLGLFDDFNSNFQESLDELEKYVSLVEALNILFTNVRNFNSVREIGFKLEEVLASVDLETVTRIHRVICFGVDVQSFEKLIKVCPKLNQLSICGEVELEILGVLHECSGIEELLFVAQNVLFYEVLLTKEWQTLKVLAISEKLQKLELHKIAKVLENLDVFSVQFVSISWDRKSHFRSLRGLITYCDEFIGNLDWFQSFSQSIKAIMIRNDIGTTSEQARTLVTDSYPNLEVINIDSLIFEMEFVNAVVDNCSQLSEFGYFEKSSVNSTEWKKYLKENTITFKPEGAEAPNIGTLIIGGDCN